MLGKSKDTTMTFFMLESPCEKTLQTTGSFPTFIIADTDAALSISEKNTLSDMSQETTQTMLG